MSRPARRLAMALAILAGVAGTWTLRAEAEVPETAPVPPTLVIFECTLQAPGNDEVEDYYNVNPTLRENYYVYLEKTLFPNREQEFQFYRQHSELFMFRARFRGTLKDFFNTNAKLVDTARTIQHYWGLPAHESGQVPAKVEFEDLEKACRRLGGHLSMLVPDLGDDSADSRQFRQLYSELARRGMFHTMVPLLLTKVDALERRLCQLFFPVSHTISLDDLGTRSTPRGDLAELRELAKAIAQRMPARGFPKAVPERQPPPGAARPRP